MGSKHTQQEPEAPRKSPPVAAARTKLRSGDVIDDRFTVMGRPLGKGGMGTVYRVHDADGIEYAIKRLSPALHEEKRFVTRFQREYDAASTLRHPNIIAYQELFNFDGVLHIRMEYNDGINLRQLLRREKHLSVDMATSVCRDLARALEHLHAHRVVHRDIKPENILLGRKGSVKLCDFGISRFEYSTVTRTGTLLGTPRYMSPEQLAGRKGEEIGPASDLYALGIVLYEMLTGKDPYRLRKKADILEVINVKQSQEPRPLPKEFDPELCDLVMQLLEHDPDMRPASARKVGQLLGRWAMSRRHQRSMFRQALDELEDGTISKRLPGPKRKRNSFWPDPTPTDAPHVDVEIPPEPTYPLLPAFMATLLFLVLLWGLGYWQQHSTTGGQEPHGAAVIPTAPSAPNRTLLLQKRTPTAPRPVSSRKRRTKRQHRRRRRRASRARRRRRHKRYRRHRRRKHYRSRRRRRTRKRRGRSRRRRTRQRRRQRRRHKRSRRSYR